MGLKTSFIFGREINTNGQIQAVGRRAIGKYLKPRKSRHGYLMVTIDLKNYYIHRLVLLAFRGPPLDHQTHTRHLDGNIKNNRLSNLKYGTPKENALDRIKHRTYLYGEKIKSSKLTWKQIKEIRSSHLFQKILAKKFGVAQSCISKIKNNVSWKEIYGNETN